MKMEGQMSGRPALSGRIVLERYNLADSDPLRRDIDEQLKRHFRRLQKLLLPTRLAAT
jgi:hypothetical protein